MRQETINTFEEGLIQDLNPINTPNSVLTDNLNGTFITYNGNEHSLQNDRGNYALKNCRLKPNYIPVGVKEYGDILYIVSYNPIDGTTEIGSYPSPLEVATTEDSIQNTIIPSIIQNASSEGTNYSELLKSIKTYLFSDDELKIYPGDEYKLTVREESTYPYEELEYFIIDDARNKYNISKEIKENKSFAPVGWNTPGWLGAQYRLATFHDFVLNMRSIEIPIFVENSNGELNCNFQFYINDPLFLTWLPDHLQELGVTLQIKHNGHVVWFEDVFHSDSWKWITKNDSTQILWFDHSVIVNQLNKASVLEIIATPFVKIDDQHKIIYDNFTTSWSHVVNKIGSYDDYVFGSQIWKFYIPQYDNSHLYLEYDVEGPIVTSGDIRLFYRILAFPDKASNSSELIPLTDFKEKSYHLGSNLMVLDFEESFMPEDMYVIELLLAEGENVPDISKGSKSVKKVIIPSRIFEYFTESNANFDLITFDQWMQKFIDVAPELFSLTDLHIDWNDNAVKEPYQIGVFNNDTQTWDNLPNSLSDTLKRLWQTSTNTEKYNHSNFVLEEEWENIRNISTQFVNGDTYQQIAKYKLSSLTGRLWDFLQLYIQHASFGQLEKNKIRIDNLPNNEQQTNANVVCGESINIKYKTIGSLINGSLNYNIVDVRPLRFKKQLKNQLGALDTTTFLIGGTWSGSGLNINKETLAQLLHASVSNYYVKKDFRGFTTPPNPLTEEISNLLQSNNTDALLMFLGVQTDNGKECSLSSSVDDTEIFGSNGATKVWPTIVMLDKTKHPIFIPFSNYRPTKIGSWWPTINDGKIEEIYPGLLTDLQETLEQTSFVNMRNLQPGYFLQLNIEKNDRLRANLSAQLNLSFDERQPSLAYNVFASDDRLAINEIISTFDMSCNLFKGNLELKDVTCNTLEYNVKFGTIDNHTYDEQLQIFNELLQNKYDIWFNDSVYAKGGRGLSVLSDTQISRKYQNSAFFAYLESNINDDGQISLPSTSTTLYFDSTAAHTNPLHIGYYNNSISIP